MPASTARTLATPRRKPSRNRLMRYERAGWTPVGLARSGRVSLGPVRFEAFGAVDRPIAPRLEGHLTRLAAAAAHDVVHGLRPYGGALGLGAAAAIQTALWLVQQALLRVELLLTGGPHECVGALPAGQRLVHEFSRHPRAPRPEILCLAVKRPLSDSHLAESRREIRARAPELVAGGLRRIDADPTHFDRARRRVSDARRRAQHQAERGDQLAYARRDAGADVVDALVVASERGHHGLGHVADVDVVALVFAVAIDRDRLSSLPAAHEDRDDPTLEVAPLPRPVDVREAERDRAERGARHEALGLRLEAAVVRRRVDGHGLVRAHRRLAVDRAAGGDVHEVGRPPFLRELEHVIPPL